MLVSLVFALSAVILGIVSAAYFFKEKLVAGIPLGILFSTWIVFVISLICGFGVFSILLSSIIGFVISALLIKKYSKKKFNRNLKLVFSHIISKEMLIVFVVSLLFFGWLNYLMFHYNTAGEIVGMPTDFGFHSSIITSIANGNFPPLNPILGVKLLVYYYFVDLFSAILLKGGLSLQFSVFFTLVPLSAAIPALIYIFIRKLKFNRKIAILSTILFLFNGSFVFIPYLQENATRGADIVNVILHPYLVPSLYISKLNGLFSLTNILYSVILTQRAFLIGIAIFLLVSVLIFEKKYKIAAILLGLLPMFHFFSFVSIFVIFGVYALWERNKRLIKALVLSIVIAAPQLLFLIGNKSATLNRIVRIHLGWMSPNSDPISILVFWFCNLGFYLLLGGIGAYMIRGEGNKQTKYLLKISIASFVLFIIANIVVFTPWIWDNFKFFVLPILLLSVLSALVLGKLWNIKNIGKVVVIIVFVLMTFSAWLSFLTFVENSNLVIFHKNDLGACKFIEKNTPANSLFLMDGEQSCIFAIAGRKVFMGPNGWIKSHGYNTKQFEKLNNEMLNGNCTLIKKYGIEYLYKGGMFGRGANIKKSFIENNLKKIYANNGSVVYKIECK